MQKDGERLLTFVRSHDQIRPKVVVPFPDEGLDGDRGKNRLGKGNDDVHECLEIGGPIHVRGLEEILRNAFEEGEKKHERHWDIPGDARQDNAPKRTDKTHVVHELEARNEGEDAGDHHEADDAIEEDVLPGEVETDEGEREAGREDHGACGDPDRRQKRIHVGRLQVFPHVRIVVERETAGNPKGIHKVIFAELEAAEQQNRDGIEDSESEANKGDDNEDLPPVFLHEDARAIDAFSGMGEAPAVILLAFRRPLACDDFGEKAHGVREKGT